MKKVISLFMTVVIISLFPICTGAYHVGDVIGYALTTDIVATINGYDIPSYNVDGYTYIVAEDLQYYGFTVFYDNSIRSLFISRDPSQIYVSKEYKKPYVPSEKVGIPERKILYTDIVTYLDGNYVPTYNIDGQTIIRFDALSAYGGVSYDNNKREISLSIPEMASNPNPNRILSKSEFLDRVSGWWVDLSSCSPIPWNDGCSLDYIRFVTNKMEIGSTYSEFYDYELEDLAFMGDNTYDALFYSPGYWYGDEYFAPEYGNATIIYDGGDKITINFDGVTWYTYTFIGTSHDYESIQRHPLVVDAARR